MMEEINEVKAQNHYKSRLLASIFGQWSLHYSNKLNEAEENDLFAIDYHRFYSLNLALYKLQKKNNNYNLVLAYTLYFLTLGNKGIQAFKMFLSYRRNLHSTQQQQLDESQSYKLQNHLLYRNIYKAKLCFTVFYSRMKFHKECNQRLMRKYYLPLQEQFQTWYYLSLQRRQKIRKEKKCKDHYYKVKKQQALKYWKTVHTKRPLYEKLLVYCHDHYLNHTISQSFTVWRMYANYIHTRSILRQTFAQQAQQTQLQHCFHRWYDSMLDQSFQNQRECKLCHTFTLYLLTRSLRYWKQTTSQRVQLRAQAHLSKQHERYYTHVIRKQTAWHDWYTAYHQTQHSVRQAIRSAEHHKRVSSCQLAWQHWYNHYHTTKCTNQVNNTLAKDVYERKKLHGSVMQWYQCAVYVSKSSSTITPAAVLLSLSLSWKQQRLSYCLGVWYAKWHQLRNHLQCWREYITYQRSKRVYLCALQHEKAPEHLARVALSRLLQGWYASQSPSFSSLCLPLPLSFQQQQTNTIQEQKEIRLREYFRIWKGYYFQYKSQHPVRRKSNRIIHSQLKPLVETTVLTPISSNNTTTDAARCVRQSPIIRKELLTLSSTTRTTVTAATAMTTTVTAKHISATIESPNSGKTVDENSLAHTPPRRNKLLFEDLPTTSRVQRGLEHTKELSWQTPFTSSQQPVDSDESKHTLSATVKLYSPSTSHFLVTVDNKEHIDPPAPPLPAAPPVARMKQPLSLEKKLELRELLVLLKDLQHQYQEIKEAESDQSNNSN